MKTVKAVCVYCGSRCGSDPRFKEAAAQLGTALAEFGVELVYGGGAIGLMGTLAAAARKSGGRVTGIIPDHLYQRELGTIAPEDFHTELHIVESMHARKAMMVSRSDAFIVLPGGIGTLDELMEILTWRQLGLHDKPVVIIDAAQYWRPFAKFLDHVIGAGFLDEGAHEFYRLVPDIPSALRELGILPIAKPRHHEAAMSEPPPRQ